MKTRRFDFNYRPLQLTYGISVFGSVPGKQDYNADEDTYTPDYTITPLVLQPSVSIRDKDEVLKSGNVNAELANVKWYEGSSTSPIGTENTDFEIVQDGDTKGQIKIKKNATVNNPITMRFYGEYVDSRTGQIFVINMSYLIQCKNSTECVPVLDVNAADVTIYNPLKDVDIQTVTASLRIGAKECDASKRKFVWEVYRTEDAVWTEVGQDELDYDITLSDDGTSCTVDRSLMGEALYMRCRAKYSKSGDPDSIVLTDASPCKLFAFVRRIPKFEFNIMGVPANIPSGTPEINPEAQIWDTNGLLDNVEKELMVLWYTAENKSAGSLTYKQVAEGIMPVLKTDMMNDTLGGMVGLDVVDRGPAGAWADTDGSLFVTANDELILIK